MGCEPQGQFVRACVCFSILHISILCILFSLPVFLLCAYVHVFIAFSLCLPIPVCLFVCLHTCVCVWLVEVDEKPRVWHGSHCGHCSVYTIFWHGLCEKYTVLLWPYKQQRTHTLSSIALIFTSFTIIRISFKPELKASRIRVKELVLINLVKTAYASHSRRP